MKHNIIYVCGALLVSATWTAVVYFFAMALN